MGAQARLPELDSVYWRQRVDENRLQRLGRLWTASLLAQTVPFLLGAVALALISPVTLPLALVALAYAWILPELYASRGAGVLRERASGAPEEERVALGLLADLVGRRALDPLKRTGLVIEQGCLGTWLVSEAGAVLVRPGGRRVNCYCVKAADPNLPRGDRIAHLLLALREDEAGFATVANLAFSGASWRLSRRLKEPRRQGLRDAVALARQTRQSSLRAGTSGRAAQPG